MGKHSVRIEPAVEWPGVTARALLQQPYIKQTEIECPLCNALIAVPETLEQQIWALVDWMGGDIDTAEMDCIISHPYDMPIIKKFVQGTVE